MKLLTSFVVKFCSFHSQSEVKFAPKLFLTCATRGANFTAQQLHSPKANLVVESSCETHDTFDVGQESKRSQNQSKMGVVKVKGLILSHKFHQTALKCYHSQCHIFSSNGLRDKPHTPCRLTATAYLFHKCVLR